MLAGKGVSTRFYHILGLRSFRLRELSGLEAISPEERERFHFLILSFYRRVENTYHQRRRRLIDEEDATGVLASSLDVLARPGAREW